MTGLQQARAEYDLSKYLQLFDGEGAQFRSVQAVLRGSFNGQVELSIMRLGVHGAFVVLNDAERLHLITSGCRPDKAGTPSQLQFDLGHDKCFRIEEADQPAWIAVLQEVQAYNSPSSDAADEKAFSITDFTRDPRTTHLSATHRPTNISFFAGVPLTSRNGHNVGAICVVDTPGRLPLTAAETSLLTDAAKQCMELLELVKDRIFTQRWNAMQKELDTFLASHSLHAQLLQEPKTTIGLRSPRSRNALRDAREGATRREVAHRPAELLLSDAGQTTVEGGESQRLLHAEAERDHRVAARDEAQNAESLTAKRGHDDERGLPTGETAYRKIFRRAAECLRSAMVVDGVLFVDGLMGHHGGIQPVAEPERELQREMVSLAAQVETPSADKISILDTGTRSPRLSDSPSSHTRLYTSSDYNKGVYVERPAEILGFSGSPEDLDLVKVSGTTLGLTNIDIGFSQRLINRHPNGALWHWSGSSFMQVKDETLVKIESEEDARKLPLVAKNARQLILKPLTDPTSLKRLGTCIAWRNKPMPVFTDAIELRSLKAFLHVVESELARYDASLVAKQKETFVSSVSHELRTPLHGILGAVQLLDESGLDTMQKPLAEIIKTCGSTLHETLISVLSYAKINQFERRQHQYRQRNPSDIVSATSERRGLASDPEKDYEGLYICTNLALLFEETLSVLEAGKSFYNPHGEEVIVVCNIEHDEHWTYLTEPGAIRRIATNLIGNALKYTNKGSILVSLSAATLIQDSERASNDLETGRTLTFTVKDTGRGMSKDFMDSQLFLPFTQEDSNSAHGVGLGMSIVKSLVSLLGAEIEVRSTEEKGTEIKVRVPMRVCRPDDDEKGETGIQFEHDLQTIRNQKLSAVMYGFPDVIRNSLTTYLRDWYGCTLLEPDPDARPDIVMVEEGNEEVTQKVRETAQRFGENGVLLSIVTVPSMMGQRMQTIHGYPKWERVPRPLGPKSVAKALLSCLKKLKELHAYGDAVTVDSPPETEEQPQHQNKFLNLQSFKEGLPYEQYLPDAEKAKIVEVLQASSIKTKSSDPKPAAKAEDPNSGKDRLGQSDKQKAVTQPESAAALRILVVDDNDLNLRLLGAFLKKNGNRNVKQAKDGKEAVDAVLASDQGFDIIFMDLSMPVMDGFEATRQIRKMEASSGSAPNAKRTVIFALTGLASRKDEEEAFDAGVDLFLTKPVQFPKLSGLLRQYQEGTLRLRNQST